MNRKAVLAPFIIYNQFMKSLSTWRSARNNHLGWFLLLTFTNTLGLLDLIYLAREKQRGPVRKLYP